MKKSQVSAEEKNYAISKEHCQSLIHGVCRQCGGRLEPIETVDNAGNPTFWAGCLPCGTFCWGVPQEVYDIAKSLVDERQYAYYSHLDSPIGRDENYKKYYRESQISGACYLVSNVIHLQKKSASLQLRPPLEGERVIRNEDGKINVPNWLQQEFYDIAGEKTDKFLKAGLLVNRFGLVSFALEMMATGYYHEANKKDAAQSAYPPVKIPISQLETDKGMREAWISVKDDLPPVCTVVLGFNRKWIDEDYEPEGIRECFYNDDGSWMSAVWNNEQDTWYNDDKTAPTYWMRRPEPPPPPQKKRKDS